MTKLTLLNYALYPYANSDGQGGGLNYAYEKPETGEIQNHVVASEAILKVRYAYGEKFLDGVFARVSVGTKYPKITAQYTKGVSGVMGSMYDYHRVNLQYNHWFNVGPIGWLRYDVRVGKTFGTLPYLLLEVAPGNETYMIESNNFNTMNRFEFASDAYAQVKLVQHFDGFFLNHIPLIRK